MLSRRTIFLPVLVLALLMLATPVFARFALEPRGEVTVVPIGKAATSKDYFKVGTSGLILPVVGPGEITGYAKVHFAPGDSLDKSVELRFSGVPGLPASRSLTFKQPKRGTYAGGRKGMPSGGKKIALTIPAGTHELRIDGGVVGGGELFLLLNYEGPEQPAFERQFKATEKPKPKKKPKKRKIKLGGFTLSSSSGLKFTYDDNAYKYSNDYIYSYLNGGPSEKWKFLNRVDDAIINPSLSLTGKRKFFDIGTTSITLKFSRLQYWHNPKLCNEEYRGSVRQDVGKGRSLELYYSYSPSKYLRQLNDRPPNVSDNISMTSQEFRLTRNKVVATWRHKLRKNLNLRLMMTRKLYFYNRPHLENDTWAYDWQATAYWTINKPFRLTLDYAYTDANALGIDVDGQVLDTSPASDGTYKGNKFNMELRWKPPFKQIVKDITVRAQYSVAYFSAEGCNTIGEDSYHVSRQDNMYTYQIKASRKLPYYPKISTNFGFGYAQRLVDSLMWGDIKADKNWISRTFWLGFSYKLF
ncbi:MAG: hypothetical protein GY835_26980 [bacterium]|nr:hypothetical protein [bacterium]